MNAATPPADRPTSTPGSHPTNRPGKRAGNHAGNRLNLNFWQWLGVVIIAVGALVYLYRHFVAEETPPIQQDVDTPAPTQAEASNETGEGGDTAVE